MSRERAKNLMIFGVDETANEKVRDTIFTLYDEVELDFNEHEIVSVTRVGKQPGKRPVKVSLISAAPKGNYFKQIPKLKEKSIFFGNDLNDRRKALRREALDLKKRLEILGKPVKVFHDSKILLDGAIMDLEEAEKLLTVGATVTRGPASNHETPRSNPARIPRGGRGGHQRLPERASLRLQNRFDTLEEDPKE